MSFHQLTALDLPFCCTVLIPRIYKIFYYIQIHLPLVDTVRPSVELSQLCVTFRKHTQS